MPDKKLPGRVRLIRDNYCEYPKNDEPLIRIAYLERSRHVLGDEAVSVDRMDEIRDGIASGELVGLRVYAYVHSEASIGCFDGPPSYPFNDRWDSGPSGYVYMTARDAHKTWGLVRGDGAKGLDGGAACAEDCRRRALEACRETVNVFNMWLTGECWGYRVDEAVEDPLRPGRQLLDENDEPVWTSAVDSCWGFIGDDWKTNGIADYIQHYVDSGYKVEKECDV